MWVWNIQQTVINKYVGLGSSRDFDRVREKRCETEFLFFNATASFVYINIKIYELREKEDGPEKENT